MLTGFIIAFSLLLLFLPTCPLVQYANGLFTRFQCIIGTSGQDFLTRLYLLGIHPFIILPNLHTSIGNSCPGCPKCAPNLDCIKVCVPGQGTGQGVDNLKLVPHYTADSLVNILCLP
jgi:hypothetical protein